MKTKVVQDEVEPIEKHILAKSIVEISRGVQKLFASGLNRKAIVLLLHDSSKVGKPAVSDVLDALRDLEKDYVQKPVKK